jgi:hypothetical protein
MNLSLFGGGYNLDPRGSLFFIFFKISCFGASRNIEELLCLNAISRGAST